METPLSSAGRASGVEVGLLQDVLVVGDHALLHDTQLVLVILDGYFVLSEGFLKLWKHNEAILWRMKKELVSKSWSRKLEQRSSLFPQERKLYNDAYKITFQCCLINIYYQQA